MSMRACECVLGEVPHLPVLVRAIRGFISTVDTLILNPGTVVSCQHDSTSALWTERRVSVRVYSLKFLLLSPETMAVAEALLPALTSFSSVQAMEGKQFDNVSE